MWIFKIAVVCLLAFVSVWYFGQKVSTVGDSMKPILRNGDVVLVNRIVYNASRPKRGDIIVFKSSLLDDNGKPKYLIKRIIGLPGDTIAIEDGYVILNGQTIQEPYVAEQGMSGEMEEITVEEGKLFVMGDNRYVSQDSRSPAVGQIDEDTVLGKVVLRIFPFNSIEYFG